MQTQFAAPVASTSSPQVHSLHSAMGFPREVPALAEEIALAPAGANRNQLLLQHLPMVRFVAKRLHGRLPGHVDLEDLVSAGLVGLLDAADKFDGSRLVQFKSYAQIRVRGAILDSLRSLDWSPRELRRQSRAMAEAIRLLSARLGRTPTDDEVATEMNMDLCEYQELTGDLAGLQVDSLNVERSEDVGDQELVYLPTPATDDPLFRLIQGQSREKLLAAIAGLPERQRLVLTLYYFEELTLKEIGLALGVGESRVSQIRLAAVNGLRTAFQQRSTAQKKPGRRAVGAPSPRKQQWA